MKLTILVDNNTKDASLLPEWGLCVYIEYNGKRFLLDAGQSDKFLQNASTLGIKITDVDYSILSHAHYDHGNGLPAFFEANSRAKCFMRKAVKENCYHKYWIFGKYIGLKKGMLSKYADRIQYVCGDVEISEGVYLIPHKTAGLDKVGKDAHFAVKCGCSYRPDDFSHEQSLVFKTDKGLVVLNSCSHAGADNIINEVQSTFPEERIYALIGGFHLFMLPDKKVESLAAKLKALDVQKIYTGHCTGERPFNILKNALGDRIEQIYTGLSVEF